MSRPYRIMVWGPGGLGSVAIWEILQSPAFELVGVRAYSDGKAGQDAGTLVGLSPVGIELSTDVEALLALESDCILMTARDTGGYNTDEELLQLLAAGHNVITPLPYQNAHLFREPAFLQRLEQACRAGQSVFHATGIDPDVVSERVLLALTGMCTHIESISLQENWDSTFSPRELLDVAGYGKPVEEARRFDAAPQVAINFLKAVGYSVGAGLGVSYSRVETSHDYVLAQSDIDSANTFIHAGTVGRLVHRFKGYVDDNPKPFFDYELNWVLGPQMLPPGVGPEDRWVVAIEGRPSLRTVIDLRASHAHDDRFYDLGGMVTEPGYHATIAPCLQAVPLVCGAQPGVLPSMGVGLHWMKDLRQLAGR